MWAIRPMVDLHLELEQLQQGYFQTTEYKYYPLEAIAQQEHVAGQALKRQELVQLLHQPEERMMDVIELLAIGGQLILHVKIIQLMIQKVYGNFQAKTI